MTAQLGRHEVVAADTPRVAQRLLTRHAAQVTHPHSGRLTLAVTATDVADAARTDVVARLATGGDVTLAHDAVRRPVHDPVHSGASLSGYDEKPHISDL